VRGLPIPVGKDWPGLALRAGGGHLVDTDAEYEISLSDYLVEFWAQPGLSVQPTTYCVQVTGGTHTMQCGLNQNGQQLVMYLGSTSVTSLATTSITGAMLHGMVAVDRDTKVYFHVNGEDAGDKTALVGEAATDIDSTNLTLGGVTINNRVLRQAMGRLIIFPAGVFPTEEELDQIAAERYDNPWEESPTLLRILDSAYTAAVRSQPNFYDVSNFTATSVPNDGTGGDFTISGSLEWAEVRTQIIRAPIAKPDEDWFTLDHNTRGINTDDLGLGAGSFIHEAIISEVSSLPVGLTLIAYSADSLNEKIQINVNTSGELWAQFRIGGSYRSVLITGPGYSEYGREGINVITQVIDAAGAWCRAYVNGIFMGKQEALPAGLDMSGDVQVVFGRNTEEDGVLASRLWYWPGAASSVPSDFLEVMRARVSDPWKRETYDYDANAIYAEYLNNTTAQSYGSTSMINLAQPGTCDLPVGGSIGNLRTLRLRGAA